MNITTNRVTEIKQLITELNSTLKMSVNKAIQIGQLLCEQKEEMNHGEFLPWLKDNISLSERTARNYMKLYHHKDKTANIADLQEAYKQIEQIEHYQKQTNEDRKRSLIAQYRRTGKKPDGWDRDCDYAIKKDEENRAYIEKERMRREQVAKERAQKKEREKVDYDRSRKEHEELLENLSRIKAQDKENIEIKKSLRLSDRHDNLSQEVIIETIDDYINSISDNQRGIETAQNLIKYLRNKIAKMQVI